MSSIIWYIYDEFRKKEEALLKAARKKSRDRQERSRGDTDGTPPCGSGDDKNR